jgi:hypothetical protein
MSDRCVLSGSYQPVLDTRRVEHAIKEVKDFFEAKLAKALNLTRVSAPLFVRRGSGINDDLNGVERPVSFLVRDAAIEAEIVQSLAKWKRLALARYGFAVGEGLYTDMNAIRPDETLDHLHSIYVDQWDWEKVIDPTERTRATLEEAVRSIYEVICRTEFYIAAHYPAIRPLLPSEIHIVTSEELQRRFPELSPREREDRRGARRRPRARWPGARLRRLEHVASGWRLRSQRRHPVAQPRARTGVRDFFDGGSRRPGRAHAPARAARHGSAGRARVSPSPSRWFAAADHGWRDRPVAVVHVLLAHSAHW